MADISGVSITDLLLRLPAVGALLVVCVLQNRQINKLVDIVDRNTAAISKWLSMMKGGGGEG